MIDDTITFPFNMGFLYGHIEIKSWNAAFHNGKLSMNADGKFKLTKHGILEVTGNFRWSTDHKDFTISDPRLWPPSIPESVKEIIIKTFKEHVHNSMKSSLKKAILMSLE